MKQTAFQLQDFEVFSVDGLDDRMNEIIQHIRPKLEILGEQFSHYLTEATGEPFFYHVAKHARRTVNPPSDTWVAFAPNKRGYKMMPHFQIGLWGTHMFVYFGLIYECPQKAEYAAMFSKQIDDIQTFIPDTFVWSVDHTKPDATLHRSLSAEDLQHMFDRLAKVKKAELLAGIHIPTNEAIQLDDASFEERIKDTFTALLPLYKMGQTM